MAAVKVNLGIIICEGHDKDGKPCGHQVMLKENEAGTLSYQCGLGCDMSTFAKKGTAAAARWRAKLPQAQAPEGVPKDDPKPAKKEAETPPPGSKPKAQPFDMLRL